jgi:hypothetical protein
MYIIVANDINAVVYEQQRPEAKWKKNNNFTLFLRFQLNNIRWLPQKKSKRLDGFSGRERKRNEIVVFLRKLGSFT